MNATVLSLFDDDGSGPRMGLRASGPGVTAAPRAGRPPRPLARSTDPETSHLAAARAAKGAKSLRQRCLNALLAAPDGLTDFELADAVGSQQTSAGVRRKELVVMGLVEWAGFCRPSPSGSAARAWRAKRGAR